MSVLDPSFVRLALRSVVKWFLYRLNVLFVHIQVVNIIKHLSLSNTSPKKFVPSYKTRMTYTCNN